MNPKFWEKKIVVSFLLSILVVMIHTSQIQALYAFDNGLHSIIAKQIYLFFHSNLSEIAVPLFFILSGFTFFYNYCGKESYKAKMKRRINTLIIPYFAWNFIYLVYNIFTSTFFSKFFVGRDEFVFTPANICLAIILHKGNLHFWFVFDLIVFSFMSPAIYLSIKNKKTAWLTVIVCMGICCWLREEYSIKTIFYKFEGLVYFVFGGVVSIHYKDLFCNISINRTMKSVILYSIVLIINQVLLFNGYKTPLMIKVCIIIVECISFWNVVEIVMARTKPKGYMRNSFFTFAFHGLILPIIIRIFYIALPKYPLWSVITLLGSVTLTMISSLAFSNALKRYLPRLSRAVGLQS